MARVRTSKLYEKWKTGVMSDRDLIHVHALIGVFDHTPVKVREKLMKDLERSAVDAGDEEIQQFLADVRRSFPVAFASPQD
jgi:hypothetical protein